MYRKIKDMLCEEVITMDVIELNVVRNALAIIDKECLKLSLLDIERLWIQYVNWHFES